MVKKKHPKTLQGKKVPTHNQRNLGETKMTQNYSPHPKAYPNHKNSKFSFLFHVFSSTDLATKKGREKPNYLFGVNHEVGGIMVAMSGSTESLGSGEEDSGLASCSSCCAIPIYNKVI